ncbi:MAG: MBL fold metallo-hydrolase [Thermoplasmata archaeon]|nr:MBL fold metallo-hydrolase [Thermoplasmata archaeon]
MRVHEIEGHGFSGNIFLIDSEKPCLIDAGWDPDIAYCTEQIKQILGGRKLHSIVLTHRHIDHVGGAMSFYGEYGGDLYAHADDAQALISGDQDSTGAKMFGGHIDPMPLTPISEGDRIDLGGGESLKVIHTPGHTVGSMCLLGPGCLFSGDTVFADGGVGRWDLDTGNYSQLLASVEKISELDVESLFPGHGPSVEGNAAAHIGLSLRHLRLIGRYG